MKKRPFLLFLQLFIAFSIVALTFLYNSFDKPEIQLHHEGGLTTYSTENDGDLTPLFLDGIHKAKRSICCLNYSIKDSSIIDALNASAKRGVEISIVYDPSASQKLDSLLDGRIKRIHYEGKGLMHMKLLAIDDEVAYVGTANFTKGSLAKHSNTVLRIVHPGMAALIKEKTQSYPKNLASAPYPFTMPGIQIDFSFLPEDKSASQRIIELIRSAERTIQVAMFTFTRMDFAKELAAAQKRGVDVSVSLDEGSMKGTSKKIAQYLARNGVEVKKGDANGLYHHKLALIDGTTWIVGSANWTKSAFGKNSEYMIVMRRN